MEIISKSMKFKNLKINKAHKKLWKELQQKQTDINNFTLFNTFICRKFILNAELKKNDNIFVNIITNCIDSFDK